MVVGKTQRWRNIDNLQVKMMTGIFIIDARLEMWCCFHPKKTHTIRTGGRRYEASKFTTPKIKKYCYKLIQIQ